MQGSRNRELTPGAGFRMLEFMATTNVSGSVDLSVQLGPLALKNPTITVSGTCGYGDEYAPFMEPAKLGAFTTKSVTLEERKGNAPARIVETAGGMLNAIGLANVGLKRFITEKLPIISNLGIPVIVNVAGHTLEEYIQVCERLDAEPSIAALELNVSCPNVKDGLVFGTDAVALEALVQQVRQVVKRSYLIVKLSPNVTDICELARAAIGGGSDCLSMVNTFVGMAIDVEKRSPILANMTGGLSGPAIKPLALNLVHKVYKDVAGPQNVPIIGMGGVRDWRDAVEFMLAGATAVGIGTSLFIDPTTPLAVIAGLEDYCRRHQVTALKELIGTLKPGRNEPPAG